ncbi:MAG: metallophosphoesterase [Synergistaceae bacterium]|nr:metallophosphoesterase [Synergistaceae bacterium]
MKKKPSPWGAWLVRIGDAFAPSNVKRSLSRLADDGFVKLGVLPEKMDGAGKILHISDTPAAMYGYLARVLRRTDPAVVIHTGDLADDIKLALYPSEADCYAAAARRLVNILLAPHRTVILALGNHDRADLLPPLPSQCVLCDNAVSMAIFGVRFRISHYVENVLENPERYNLFGHDPGRGSFVDDEGRYFLNGMDAMRMIDPVTEEMWPLSYPKSAFNARNMRGGRMAK